MNESMGVMSDGNEKRRGKNDQQTWNKEDERMYVCTCVWVRVCRVCGVCE